MVGRTNTGGGGSGGTLTVTGIAGHTVTVTKDGKTYTRTFNSGGVAVFKGLSTGTWTVKMSGNGQTATRTVTITADYSLTIAYFSATIKVTYPAKSKCVIKNSSGTQVASNTNTGTSAKTWTATVNAKGTYTVTATATDGSGKTKSTTVSITADGQVKTATLVYETVLWEAGADQNTSITGGFAANNTTYVKIGNSTVTITGECTYFGEGSHAWSYSGNFYTKKKVTKGEFKYFCANITKNTGTHDGNKVWLYAANKPEFTNDNTITRLEIPVNTSTGKTGVFRMPLTGITSAVLGIRVYGWNNKQTIVTDKIWLE